MIIIGGIIQFNFEQRAEAIGIIRQMMADSQAEEGCIAYTFSVDVDAEDTFHLYEVWKNADALAAHGQMPHYAAFMQKMRPQIAASNIKRYIAEIAPS